MEEFLSNNWIFLAIILVVLVIFLIVFFRSHSKKKVKETLVKEETKKEVKEEVKEVVKEEVKQEIKQEVKEEVVTKEEVKETPKMVIRYRKSFLAKLILNNELQPIYQEIRDCLMSYKNVKSHLSFKYERFNVGRKTLAKLTVRGKKLYLYLALPYNEQEEKYHLVNVGDTKIGETLPSLLKVLSSRSIKYATILIDKMMNENNLIKLEEVKEFDYANLLRKRTLEELINEGLVVEYEASEINIESVDFLSDEELKEITPEKADNIVSDEIVNKKVKIVSKNRLGKFESINLGDISKKFNNNDLVNLESLKAKKLINRNTQRIKILASGYLDKKLRVEADEFSLTAMKMIIYKEGKVILVK